MSSFQILSTPCRSWSRDHGIYVLRAYIVLQNMYVESRRQGYDSEMFQTAVDGGDAVQFGADYNVKFFWKDKESVSSSAPAGTWASIVAPRHDEITDETEHHALKHGLIEHTWDLRVKEMGSI